jgi:GT2 family glycosyltransferase
MISSNKILIVIVSFNDSFSLNRLINSINHEKFNVFIFDNSTDLSNQDRVKAYGSIKNISVVGFGKNYGIGYALKGMKNITWKELIMLPLVIPLVASGSSYV